MSFQARALHLFLGPDILKGLLFMLCKMASKDRRSSFAVNKIEDFINLDGLDNLGAKSKPEHETRETSAYFKITEFWHAVDAVGK